MQQKPLQIRISHYILYCGGLASNEEDFSETDLLLIWLSVSFPYQFCSSCTNWYLGKIRVKIRMLEGNKANRKMPRKSALNCINFLPSEFSRGTEQIEMSDVL